MTFAESREEQPAGPFGRLASYRRVAQTHIHSVWDIARAVGELRRYLYLRLRYRNFRVPLFFVHPGMDIEVGPDADVRFGVPVHFMRDFTGRFYGRVTIGNNVFFNRGAYVSIHESLVIGDNCLFGESVSIHDENHVAGPGETPISERGLTTKPIHIGRNVWLGAKVTVLGGVTIGDNAVVGANAVVSRDIPPNVLAAGVPAKVIKELP